jgi:hypothetical protein
MAAYGIGAASGRRLTSQPAPAAPGQGSGGAGSLRAAPAAIGGAVRTDVSDATAGRLTLGVVELSLVALIAFYVWTRSAQGG